MPADVVASTGAAGGVSEPEVRAPRRSAAEVVRDLERERAGLVEAVDRLKVEASATKARVLAPRNLAIAGGTVGLLIALRIWRKRR